ncbi:MAG: hypothetical protein AAF192_01210 [Pseudomonadota bacterium]
MARRIPYGEEAPTDGLAARLFDAVYASPLFVGPATAAVWIAWGRGLFDLISSL